MDLSSLLFGLTKRWWETFLNSWMGIIVRKFFFNGTTDCDYVKRSGNTLLCHGMGIVDVLLLLNGRSNWDVIRECKSARGEPLKQATGTNTLALLSTRIDWDWWGVQVMESDRKKMKPDKCARLGGALLTYFYCRESGLFFDGFLLEKMLVGLVRLPVVRNVLN